MEELKILMIGVVDVINDPLLHYWFTTFDKERDESKLDIEALLVLKNYAKVPKLLDKIVSVKEPGYLDLINAGDIFDRELWNLGFQYAIMNKYNQIFTLKPNFNPNDGIVTDLLKFSQRENVGAVSAFVPVHYNVKGEDKFFIGAKIMKHNIMGQKQAGDKDKELVWCDAIHFSTAMFNIKAVIKTPLIINIDPRWKPIAWEYEYTNRIKKSGFNVIMNKNAESFMLFHNPLKDELSVCSLRSMPTKPQEDQIIKRPF